MKKNIKTSVILFCLVWAFFIWLSLYFLKGDFSQREFEKGRLLVKNIAALNQYPLQNQMETRLRLENENAVILDAQEKILVPFSRYGFPSPLVEEGKGEGKYFFEEPILSDQKEMLGKVVLEFRPDSPPFLFLRLALLFPPLLGLGGWFFLHEKIRLQKKGETKKEEHFEWIGSLKKLGLGAIYCFDESGKILASSEGAANGHVLDIFPDAEEARAVLSHDSPHPTGCWENHYGEKRFLVTLS